MLMIISYIINALFSYYYYKIMEINFDKLQDLQ